MQWFPDQLIKDQQKLTRPERPSIHAKYYLGVDVGGRGGSESTFQIIQKISDTKFIQVESLATNYEMLTMTERQILHLDAIWNFKRILIDDGGLGAGVYDHLLENKQVKNKIEAINNSKRNLTPNTAEKERKTSLMKNDLYDNALCIMERGEIELLDDPNIFQSLKSVQFEITENKELQIFGNYTHICEGLIRALWGAVKDKSLNLW